MAHDPITEAFCNTIKSVAVAYPAIPAERIEHALDIIRNTEPTAATEPPKPRAIIPHAEAAALLNRSTQAVAAMARAGLIRRAYVPGRARAAGYVAADILAIVNGENAPTAEATEKNREAAARAAAARRSKQAEITAKATATRKAKREAA